MVVGGLLKEAQNAIIGCRLCCRRARCAGLRPSRCRCGCCRRRCAAACCCIRAGGKAASTCRVGPLGSRLVVALRLLGWRGSCLRRCRRHSSRLPSGGGRVRCRWFWSPSLAACRCRVAAACRRRRCALLLGGGQCCRSALDFGAAQGADGGQPLMHRRYIIFMHRRQHRRRGVRPRHRRPCYPRHAALRAGRHLWRAGRAARGWGRRRELRGRPEWHARRRGSRCCSACVSWTGLWRHMCCCCLLRRVQLRCCGGSRCGSRQACGRLCRRTYACRLRCRRRRCLHPTSRCRRGGRCRGSRRRSRRQQLLQQRRHALACLWRQAQG